MQNAHRSKTGGEDEPVFQSGQDKPHEGLGGAGAFLYDEAGEFPEMSDVFDRFHPAGSDEVGLYSIRLSFMEFVRDEAESSEGHEP